VPAAKGGAPAAPAAAGANTWVLKQWCAEGGREEGVRQAQTFRCYMRDASTCAAKEASFSVSCHSGCAWGSCCCWGQHLCVDTVVVS
jgi:hypothetical protein